jgi:hypothetical protein
MFSKCHMFFFKVPLSAIFLPLIVRKKTFLLVCNFGLEIVHNSRGENWPKEGSKMPSWRVLLYCGYETRTKSPKMWHKLGGIRVWPN